MAYIHLKEVWTPLKLVNVRVFREPSTGKWYIKRKNQRLRRLRR